MPVERILVASDRSETASRAVAWAVELAERYGAELLVLQVVAADPEAVEPELVRYAAERAPGARARAVAGEDPAAAIVQAAREERADVIVVGSVGMSGRREFLLGNVPNRVSHQAGCTVVIVDTAEPERSGPRLPWRKR